jgi:tripartite-type tricarboxylate transporter receptor subunit TctC
MVRMLGVLALCAVAALAPHPVAAQALSGQIWQPTKPITIVIPFPPGPGLDLVARMVGDKLSASIGQPVVYENRTGASGSIAAEYVARAAPDGTILMAAATSTHATNVHLIKNLSYDPVKNFTPIIESVETIGCIVVNTSVVPVNSIAELVAYAKANPGKLSFGSSGAGSFFHLAGELFNQVNGVNLAHVPYRGSVAAFTDLIGGHIQVNFTQLSQAVAYRDNPNLKVLAVLEETRFSRWPDYPSITEALPSYKMPPTWNGIVGPPGLPEPILQRLNAELNKALSLPEVRTKLEDNGYRVVGGTGEAFGKRIRDDIAFYGPIFKAVGVQAQ